MSRSESRPDRRHVVIAGAALLGSAALPAAAAPEPGLAPAADLLARTRAFLATLEPDKRKAA